MKYNETTVYAVGLDNKNNCSEAVPISGITASNSQPKYPASYAIDNSSTTRWANNGKGSWIQLDLGSVQNICSVDTSWFMQNPRIYNFVLATSTDGINFPNKIENKSNGTALGPEKYYMNDTKARVIRITINGNSENNYASMSDIKVYGALKQPSTEMSSDGNKEVNPSISVGTDDSKYSQGEQVTILGRVYNGTGFSPETLHLLVNRTHYELLGGVGGYRILNESEVVPTTVVSILSDSLGRYNYNMSLQETGKYLVSASANISGNNIQSISGFEVKNFFFSRSAIMVYFGLAFFLGLLVVIWHGNSKFGDLRDPVIWRLNQKKIANNELLRFLCLSGIAGFSILSFVFADSEVGVNSPIGLVKQNFAVLNKTEMQSAGSNQESQWVINVGGSQKDNYSGGIQIPTYVVIFGLAGGYLRYLYGLRFFFGRLSKKQQFEDTDKNWGDLNVMDNMSFLRHSLRSLSLFFLAPLLAIAVWFILFQGGTTGKWAIAAVSFSIGLITEEVVQVIISFVRRILVGIKEDTTKEKEEAKIKVVRTIPADGSSGVSVFTDILASFEVPVEKETVENGFKVFVESEKEMAPVLGKPIQGENTLTYRFVPESRKLDPDSTYVASIEGVVDLVGRACEITTWLFSTRSKPSVLTIKPADKQKVPIDSKITVEFSEPVDVESVKNHFTVKENGTTIKGKIEVDGKFATFMPPNEKFEKNKTYTVELTEEIKDLAGNGLYPGKTWKFSTE